MSAHDQAVTPERILQMAWGYAPPLVLEAAIRHKVFDSLDNGPKNVAELLPLTNTSRRGLTIILNVLVGLQFLSKNGDKYALTPESATFLVRSKPSFMGGMILHTSEQLLPKWLHLNQIVTTGKPDHAVNQQKDGEEFFHQFVNDIFPMSYPGAQALAAHLNLTGPKSILDLAAGSGVWSIALAQHSPEVKVTVVDWPGVIDVAKANAEKFGIGSRFTYHQGDLASADFGTGHDLATLGHILHSEGETRSRTLLKKTFGALNSGGTIAIQEFLVNADRTGPVNGLIFAVNMLVNTDEGDTYSFEEISSWLTDAGFVNARQLPAPGPSPLILATKP